MTVPAPNPGSPEAVTQGCVCPAPDNHNGVRAPSGGWWVNADCALHDPWPPDHDYDDDRPGMMRIHVAEQRGRLLAETYSRADLRILAQQHGVPTGYRRKRDLAVAQAFAGVKP